MSDQSAATRFLRAFHSIEQHLKRTVRADRFESFATTLRHAAKSDPAVRRRETDLLEYAELRNAIVHREMGDGAPIAEPHARIVEQVEHLYRLLTAPPGLLPEFQVEVATCSTTERVGDALGVMLGNDFSQMPVYDGDSFYGLLTTDTVARWLADQLRDIDLVEEAPVEYVLQYTEQPDHFLFLAKTATPFEAMDGFQRFEEEGRRLDAILVTHSGKQSESLLGIVTIADIPTLVGMVS